MVRTARQATKHWLAAAAIAWGVPALAAGVFDVNNKAPESAIVTVGTSSPSDTNASSPMLDQLRGVLGHLDKAQCTELRATATAAALVDAPADALHVGVVHTRLGDATHDVEIVRSGAGAYFARDLDSKNPRQAGKVQRLNSMKFAKLAAQWPAYRGGYAMPKDGVARTKVSPLPKPYTPGVYYFDKDLLGERMLGGRVTSLTATKRDLSTETLLIRLPKSYSARRPVGVLVYVDPSETADIYDALHAAADELGLIIVAAQKTGNDVYATDRWQLVLDGLATVQERYLVDPRRVYITGISGGGQISTHMVICFPDLFAGAVPIVALGSYENIPTGTGKMWQGTFGKPKPAVLKVAQTRRIAAITGDQDFNQKIIHLAADVLTKDGFNVRVDDYKDMGHGAPTAPRFTEALKWVDEPYRKVREAEEKDAQEAVKKALALKDDARKQALVEVTRQAPWSEAAWQAADALGVRAGGE